MLSAKRSSPKNDCSILKRRRSRSRAVGPDDIRIAASPCAWFKLERGFNAPTERSTSFLAKDWRATVLPAIGKLSIVKGSGESSMTEHWISWIWIPLCATLIHNLHFVRLTHRPISLNGFSRIRMASATGLAGPMSVPSSAYHKSRTPAWNDLLAIRRAAPRAIAKSTGPAGSPYWTPKDDVTFK